GLAINDRDQVLIGGTCGAALCSAGVVELLGSLGGRPSETAPVALNNAGQVIGSAETAELTVVHPFLYSAGAMRDLDASGDFRTLVTALNESGQIVGSGGIGLGPTSAVLYDGGSRLDIGGLLPPGGLIFS